MFAKRCSWTAWGARCALVAVLLAVFAAHAGADAVAAARLPDEARDVLKRLEQGGPYRYDRDGALFGNYERALPPRDRGYYREYTVDTPGLRHRGARRLVIGCHRSGGIDRPASGATFAGFRDCAGPAEVYYTEDHYRTFTRVVP